MTDPLEKNFGNQLNYLATYIRDNYNDQSPDSSFAFYVFNCTASKIPFSFLSNSTTGNIDIKKLDQAPPLSVMGYEMANGKSFSQELLTAWEKGLKRLAKRQVFTLDRQTFFYRPLELLGIILGTIHHPNIGKEEQDWLKQVLIEGENKLDKNESWIFLISFYAANLVDVSWKPNKYLFPEDMNIDELALIKWLDYTNPLITQKVALNQFEKISKFLLENFLEKPLEIQDVSRAAILYFALKKTVDDHLQYRIKMISSQEDKEQYMIKSDNQIRILHLSDIHLGTMEQAQSYFTQLATDLTQNLAVKQLNYLVISGDIANYSTVDEYDAAFHLVNKLVNRYSLTPEKVVIVPGNHDLNWDLSEEAYNFVPKRKLPKNLPEGHYIDAGEAGKLIRDEEEYQQRFKYFSDRFYKQVYNQPYPLQYDQQAILYPCPQDTILFLGLNSCWELDHFYKERSSINSIALSNAIEQILGNYDDWLKIAIWHHPVNSAESMKNTAFLEQLAVNGFQIGIHGHIHEAKDEYFQYDTNRGLKIIAAGTFGAPAHEQVTGIPLQYNLLVLDPETGVLTVETRKKEKRDGAWEADARWGDKNNPSPRYTIPLRYGSGKGVASDVKKERNKQRNVTNQSIFTNMTVNGDLNINGNITQSNNS